MKVHSVSCDYLRVRLILSQADSISDRTNPHESCQMRLEPPHVACRTVSHVTYSPKLKAILACKGRFSRLIPLIPADPLGRPRRPFTTARCSNTSTTRQIALDSKMKITCIGAGYVGGGFSGDSIGWANERSTIDWHKLVTVL